MNKGQQTLRIKNGGQHDGMYHAHLSAPIIVQDVKIFYSFVNSNVRWARYITAGRYMPFLKKNNTITTN